MSYTSRVFRKTMRGAGVPAALSVSALSVAALCMAATASAETTLKVSSCVTKTDDQVKTYLQLFHEPVNKAKNGVTLNYIGGPEITPRTKQGGALKRGLMDMIHCPSSYYAGMVPEARLLLLSNRGPDELRKDGAYKYLQKAWAKGLNARFVSWPHWGGSAFHIYLKEKAELSTKTGIRLNGKRIRSTAAYTPFLKVMGAVPVDMGAGDLYTALQRGVVAGFAWPEGGIAQRGWQDHVKYRYEPSFWRSSTAVVMNLDKWNSLSRKDKDVIEAAGIEYERTSGALLRKLADIDNEKVMKAGVEPVVLKGQYAEAYLATINNAVWDFVGKAIGDKLSTPFPTLKAALYKE